MPKSKHSREKEIWTPVRRRRRDRCQAMTQNGERCRRPRRVDQNYCHIHSASASETQQVPRRLNPDVISHIGSFLSPWTDLHLQTYALVSTNFDQGIGNVKLKRLDWFKKTIKSEIAKNKLVVSNIYRVYARANEVEISKHRIQREIDRCASKLREIQDQIRMHRTRNLPTARLTNNLRKQFAQKLRLRVKTSSLQRQQNALAHLMIRREGGGLLIQNNHYRLNIMSYNHQYEKESATFLRRLFQLRTSTQNDGRILRLLAEYRRNHVRWDHGPLSQNPESWGPRADHTLPIDGRLQRFTELINGFHSNHNQINLVFQPRGIYDFAMR